MLRVLQFDKEQNSISETSIDNMNFDSLKWLDCYNPQKEEIEELNKFVNIPQTEFERALDEDERPGTTELENFSMIIFKNPIKIKKGIETTSFAILVSDNLLVTIRKRDVEAINGLWNLDSNTQKSFFSKGSNYLTYQLMEKIMDHYFTIFDDIEADVNKIENRVFNNPDKETVQEIFTLKKTLIFFHRSLTANRDVIFNIVNEYAHNIRPVEANRFRYVQEDLVQLIDVVAIYREILMSSLDVYLSSVSNNMNTIMKRMAALGSLVLVPTFITGLYGMNFRFLPELEWQYGYVFAWAMILLSITLLYWYFKQKEWF